MCVLGPCRHRGATPLRLCACAAECVQGKVFSKTLGAPGTLEYRVNFFFKDTETGEDVQLSPWHDVPLWNADGKQRTIFAFMCVCPFETCHVGVWLACVLAEAGSKLSLALFLACPSPAQPHCSSVVAVPLVPPTLHPLTTPLLLPPPPSLLPPTPGPGELCSGSANFIVEIPKWTRRKMEIATRELFNPIKQDTQNGRPREYYWGDMLVRVKLCLCFFPARPPWVSSMTCHCCQCCGCQCFRAFEPSHLMCPVRMILSQFNYGAFPQTWEDPEHITADTGARGDNDPLDAIEIGSKQWSTGSIVRVKILGVLAMIDSGETDWKVGAASQLCES